MKKIVVIGPVYPYKGGIAHYTSLMYKALKKKFDTVLVSYSMQYPKILFKKPQKDYNNDTFKIDEANYWINTANPFSCICSALRIKKEKPDLVIFQWWHPYFAPCYRLMELALGKNVKKLFVCHNVFPHERFPMDSFLAKMVLKHGNYFITQSKDDTKDLISIKASAQYIQTVHPTYNAFKIKGMTKEEARKLLHIPDEHTILLFFGFVREYKGLKYLIEAMPLIVKQCPNVQLYIVGAFEKDKESYLAQIKTNHVEDYIKIYDEYIPDNEVEKFFAACDLVILPYVSATQSGIVQIAYGFEKPVIVTDVGGLPEVVDDGKTGYIVPAKQSNAIAQRVKNFIQNKEHDQFRKFIEDEAYRFSWDRIVEVVEELCGWK